jgi:hypothetical protein
MDERTHNLVSAILDDVREWRVSIESAIPLLELALRREVSPTTPETGATRPGPPAGELESAFDRFQSWLERRRRAAR